jgi:hypothetical protein
MASDLLSIFILSSSEFAFENTAILSLIGTKIPFVGNPLYSSNYKNFS